MARALGGVSRLHRGQSPPPRSREGDEETEVQPPLHPDPQVLLLRVSRTVTPVSEGAGGKDTAGTHTPPHPFTGMCMCPPPTNTDT